MKKDETGSPGLTVAVSVDGKTVWAEGIGYADIENRVKCTPDSVFRIASISKSVTMATVAKLVESGDLDLDKPVQYYVPEFPDKFWEGQKVEITTRHLLSHLGGIRHYRDGYMKRKQRSSTNETSKKASQKSSKDADLMTNEHNKKSELDEDKSDCEVLLEEYYITNHYNSVQESLSLFKDDPLIHKPGTKFLYTTHGWTLISAVVEKAAKMPFEKYLQQTLNDLGLENTYMDEHKPLIKNRGRHYTKNQTGHVENAPYVDLSYKWAGGGLISNVLDVAQFGNAMLFSFQARQLSTISRQRRQPDKDDQNQTREEEESDESYETNVKLSAYLKPETMKMMWTPAVYPEPRWEGIVNTGYGMGWSVRRNGYEYAFGKDQTFYASHTGNAIGASSVLLILPLRNTRLTNRKMTVLEDTIDKRTDCSHLVKELQVPNVLNSSPPKGVVVAIIVNMSSVGLNKTAYDIAKIFEQVDCLK